MLKLAKLHAALPTHPDRAPLGAGRVARAAPVHEALKGQDRVLAHGARIVAHVGLAGGDVWQADAALVPELNEQTHPSTAFRVVARAKVRLTPGYSLRFRAACVRSGVHQHLTGADWAYVGTGGAIKVSVTYDNGVDDPLAVSRTVTPKASKLENGLEPEGNGAAWADLHEVLGDLFPPELFESAAVARRWSEGVDATITIYFRGGVRVVDLCVYEAPTRYARDTTEDDVESYSTHLHTSGAADPLPVYPSPWPTTRRSDAGGGDPTGGPLAALHVAARQGRVLGPMLLAWSSWLESQDVALTEAAPVSSTSTSWVQPLAPAVTSWAPTRAGWAAGSPGMARRADLAGPLELRGVAAVVPVRVRAWCRVTDDASPGALRLQAGDYSIAELPVTSESWAWREVLGWLECGLNGDDPQSWQLLVKAGGGGSAVEVRYLAVDYAAG